VQEKENKMRAQRALRESISDVVSGQGCRCVGLVPVEYWLHDA